MRRRDLRPTRLITAIGSAMLAWWLLDVAGLWSHQTSFSQILCFMLCVTGIDRIMSFVIDLVTIAFAPIETLKHRE